ncbi:hypothetical protein Hamer_G012516 [Homarus americanus]|uniref:Uncharacterized protein n=1 Tax=Homarus americanus TaxID=6706 RepID=A0A8J5N0Y2_HOMAM|nr:hypothetical protein Hamer_G012516 [Homarus americanus]
MVSEDVVVSEEDEVVVDSEREVPQDTQEAQCVVDSVAEEVFVEAVVALTLDTVVASEAISEVDSEATHTDKLVALASVAVEQGHLVGVMVVVDMGMVATGAGATAVVDIGEPQGDVAVAVEDMKGDTRNEGEYHKASRGSYGGPPMKRPRMDGESGYGNSGYGGGYNSSNYDSYGGSNYNSGPNYSSSGSGYDGYKSNTGYDSTYGGGQSYGGSSNYENYDSRGGYGTSQGYENGTY